MVGQSTPEATATIVVESSEPMRSSLRSYFIDRNLPVCGAMVGEIPFPDGAAITTIVRGAALLVAEDSTLLEAGDHVYVLASPEGDAIVQLLFGRPEVIE
jgi:NhaP-type Na+/H+ and K+/H+ antiporter